MTQVRTCILLVVAGLAAGPAGPMFANGAATASASASSSPGAPPPAQNARAPWMDNFFFGGGVGLGFGTVDWVALEPLIGYRINPHVSIGASLLYQWMNDDRYDQSVSTTSYGGSGFVQYYPVPDFFLQAEYQYLNYDYVLSDLTTQRATASSYFGGVGVSQPMSGKAAFFASALYDFSYEANDPTSPYTSPWIIRAGVAVGF